MAGAGAQPPDSRSRGSDSGGSPRLLLPGLSCPGRLTSSGALFLFAEELLGCDCPARWLLAAGNTGHELSFSFSPDVSSDTPPDGFWLQVKETDKEMTYIR